MTLMNIAAFFKVALIIFELLSVSRSVFVRPKKPDYNELETWPHSNLSSDPQFIEICKQMAGYYKNPNKNPALKNTLVLSAVNNGYTDFLHNFKCYMDRLGIKFLPLSLDKGIYTYITENKIAPTYLLKDIPGRERVNAEPSGFGGRNFNLIGCRKMEAVGAALRLGYDVVFSDVDIAVLRDPLPQLFFPGVDYVHTENKGCGGKWRFHEEMEGNTGFYSAVANAQTVRTWDLTYRACARAPLYDDQTMFWLILRTNESPAPQPLSVCPAVHTQPATAHVGGRNHSAVVSCPLNNCEFSTAGLRDQSNFQTLVGQLRNRNKKAVTVHANWMNGKALKKEALQRAGLWIARRPNKNALVGKTTKVDVSSRAGNWTCMSPSGALLQ